MATLTGQPVATTFKDLLQMGNSGEGLTGTTRTVQDGDGTNSPLQLSSDAVNMNGTFQLNGVTLTASATALNNTITSSTTSSLDNSIVTYDGTSGNTFQDTDVTVVGGVLTLKNATSPTINVGSTALSTGSAVIKVGNARTGDGASSIDLIGDTTNSSYGLRLIRAGGVNGSSDILHVGTGVFGITATSEIELNATTIDINGTVDVSGITTINNNLIATGTATISGVSQFNSAVNIGIDGTGKDLKVFGPTAGSFMEFDATHNKLHLKYDTASSRTEPLLHLQSTRSTSTEEMMRIEGGTDAQPYISFYNPDGASPTVIKEHARIQWDTLNDRMIFGIAPRVLGATGTQYKFGFSNAGSLTNPSSDFVIERNLITIGINVTGNRADLRVWGDSLLAGVEFTSLTGTGSVAVTNILDEDDLASNSATALATQQSIKAYVDASGGGGGGGGNLDFQGDSGGVLTITLASEVLDIAGGTGIDTVGSGNILTASIDSTVTTLTGSQTLTNKTLTTPIISGTAVTATGAELNILDGVTSTTAELNILDGVTSTTAELNILDGVTSTTAELNYNDTGAVVGTVVASKTVTVDGNKDVTGFREVVATGFTGTLDGVLGGGTPAAATVTTLNGVTAPTAQYTTALNTKLAGIETAADVTDSTNVLASLTGQEVVATGFTGTLDGVLGGGTPAAATTTTLEFSSLSGTGLVAITDILDEDNLVSNSATALATQQSIKAYVDSGMTAQDLDFQGDSGGALSIDLDSEVLDIAGGTGIDTAGSGNTLTVNIDSTVATLAGSQTLTNKILSAPTISGVATHGGNIVSDTDSTDSLGTTLVRWLGIWTDNINGVTAPTAQYTTAEETKLSGIETSADVTDSTNVLASLTGQEVVATGFTGTLDGVLGGGTPAAATVTTLNGITAPTAQYTTAEETKLAGIETAADVTDSTNVLASLTGQEVVATGFTGTLDGVLGGGTPAAATVTTLNGVTAPTAQYTTALNTKLAGIETAADVTDSTNVLASLVGQEAVATGFTGTLDGVLGGGIPAAATTTTLGFTSLSGTGSVAITDILDEDDMASNSATKLSTQQSIKAYVDATSTSQDLDFQGDSGGVLSIDLDSEVLDIAGGTGIDTVGSGNTLTASIDSTVATLAGTQTLTNKTLTTPIISGTAVTATGAELNILDGVTSTAAELNILDGVTSTTTELNILDGVTSSTAELNILDGVTSTAAELNYNDTGAAVGTVVASKTVTVDANKDVTGFRQVVATGFTGTLDGVLGGGTPAAATVTTLNGVTAPTAQYTTALNTKLAGIGTAADVAGPASSTDNAIVRFNSTTGKLLQNSTVTISDAGAIAAASLTLTTDLAVAQGGTGAGTFAANGILYGAGTGAIAATAVGTDGHVLTSNGSGSAPTFQEAGGGATDINGLSDALTNSSGGTIGIGTGALAADDGSANKNTALGFDALNDATTAEFNVAVGYQALDSLSTSYGLNTAVGYQALGGATTGFNHVAIGYHALLSSTDGEGHTAVGRNAGAGAGATTDNSTFVGVFAGDAATGSYVTVVGKMAGRNAATRTVAVGADALGAGTGANNTAIGSNTLTDSTTGTTNTALGYQAGNTTTTGTNNMFLGYDAEGSSATVSNEITLGNASVDNVRFPQDGIIINFGVDSDTTLTHVPDKGLLLNGKGITGLTGINSGQIGGRRNIVYNGEMKLAQRSTSETGLGAAAGYFTLDRWNVAINAASAGRYTMAQVADGPAGFANSLKISTTTADTSIAASELLILQQRFEGQDLQQLQKGTATSKQVTVSFYVKGNASATYTCEFNDVDNGRQIAQEFAVTTSWNRIELTFAADTSDPLDDDNARSLDLNFWLHAGSTYTGGTFSSNAWKDSVANTRASDSQTSIFDADSRTFFLTGVQMEIGATATEFESRTFGDELALCQRYYEIGGVGGEGQIFSTSNNATFNSNCTWSYKTRKRATPTVSLNTTTARFDDAGIGSAVITSGLSLAAQGNSVDGFSANMEGTCATTHVYTQFHAGYLLSTGNTDNTLWQSSAEL
tara:strand:- start:136 stop:6243 length:6108 start_codon:yes stop_codon:yes gene_type:complete